MKKFAFPNRIATTTERMSNIVLYRWTAVLLIQFRVVKEPKYVAIAVALYYLRDYIELDEHQLHFDHR
ncbi:hypothetical protein BDN71DRAFT_997511 [Pleurotus eryngii]|uniref:Uncharacterized protein n=1 Tax=Pleurotus eryngii TaxID=5323 RepID=A0A9P5ZU60_PLEER|nr:hypothetical protein BDN71DRAFT_997511 [Pleurotus eryngii]